MGWKRCIDPDSAWEPENHVRRPEQTEMFLNSHAAVKETLIQRENVCLTVNLMLTNPGGKGHR